MRKIISLLLLSIVAAIFTATTAYAHATMSEFYPNPNVNEGVVRFFFDDDEFMSHVAITVYDTFGTQIATATTDARGHFDFSGLANVSHVIARYDAEHIQIHSVAVGGAYIVGKSFGGTYVAYAHLGYLLRSFVLARYWLNIFVLVIPAAVFVISLVFFVMQAKKSRR